MLDIARALNDEGIASPPPESSGPQQRGLHGHSGLGYLSSKTSVYAILSNEVYTGTLVWGTSAKPESTDSYRWTA